MSFDINSPVVQAHLSNLQGVISRMAGNSAVCKNLCVTLVGTIGAVAAATKVYDVLLVSVVPILIFCWLDAQYLMLERGFRNSFNRDADNAKKGTLKEADLFKVIPTWPGTNFCEWRSSFWSWSVRYVYPPILAIIIGGWAYLK